MQLFFGSNILFARMRIMGTAMREYDKVLVDTGAFKTCIPFTDCIQLRLQFVGTHNASGLFGEGELPLFECNIAFDDNDSHSALTVLGVPMDAPLIGRDILSKYKFEIDWVSKTANAYRLI